MMRQVHLLFYVRRGIDDNTGAIITDQFGDAFGSDAFEYEGHAGAYSMPAMTDHRLMVRFKAGRPRTRASKSLRNPALLRR